MPPDEWLLERLRADDASALAALLDRHWAPLVAFLVRSTGSSPDHASDIAQEAFCRLWERRALWRAEGSVRGLLFRLVRNLAVSEHRRRVARDRAASALVESLDTAVPPGGAPERDELRVALERGIAALPARRREVFLLRRVEGLSHKQIAELMGTSTQTVANQLSHALATLRRDLAHLVE
ncbi:MAG: sigma-70 family RNA polymerase sigma factor [Gemmatimonadaceae bacterium]